MHVARRQTDGVPTYSTEAAKADAVFDTMPVWDIFSMSQRLCCCHNRKPMSYVWRIQCRPCYVCVRCQTGGSLAAYYIRYVARSKVLYITGTMLLSIKTADILYPLHGAEAVSSL